MKRALTAALVLFALIAQRPANAGSLAGVTLADSAKAGDQTLVLNGMGLRTKYMFKVYVAGLYLAAKEKEPAKILATDGPRRMVMHFVRSVSADKICEGWDEGLAANTPNASAELKKQFATLCTWMEQTQDGSEVTLTYTPGGGTSVDVGAKHKGILPGKEFADALLACWIGPKPGPGEDFKKGVLGS
jgi:hypothetical protein